MILNDFLNFLQAEEEEGKKIEERKIYTEINALKNEEEKKYATQLFNLVNNKKIKCRKSKSNEVEFFKDINTKISFSSDEEISKDVLSKICKQLGVQAPEKTELSSAQGDPNQTKSSSNLNFNNLNNDERKSVLSDTETNQKPNVTIAPKKVTLKPENGASLETLKAKLEMAFKENNIENAVITENTESNALNVELPKENLIKSIHVILRTCGKDAKITFSAEIQKDFPSIEKACEEFKKNDNMTLEEFTSSALQKGQKNSQQK